MTLFRNKKILIIGDVMIDSYLFGNVERVSPEAPVPIIDIELKQDKLGGAANVAANIKNLGGTPILCSVIGKDQKGDTFLSILKDMEIKTDYIYQSEHRITTVKTRIIGNSGSGNHQMLRIDEEIKTVLHDQNKLLSLIDSVLEKETIDCILFQDYDKGILNELNINIITEKVKSLKIPTIADPKKKNFAHYKNVNLFKPNFKEFKEGMVKEGLNIDSLDRVALLENGAKILHKRGIEIIFVTLSEDGIFISYKKNNKIINKIIPGIKRNIVDVSGAGDSVISVISILLGDLDIEKIAEIANIVGIMACEEIGVVSINKDKLMNEISISNIILKSS
jgi:rfaE bifunctional protein kinase chain/domain